MTVLNRGRRKTKTEARTDAMHHIVWDPPKMPATIPVPEADIQMHIFEEAIRSAMMANFCIRVAKYEAEMNNSLMRADAGEAAE